MFSVAKMTALPNLVYRFSVAPVRIPASPLLDADGLSEVHGERQSAQQSQHNTEGEEPN